MLCCSHTRTATSCRTWSASACRDCATGCGEAAARGRRRPGHPAPAACRDHPSRGHQDPFLALWGGPAARQGAKRAERSGRWHLMLLGTVLRGRRPVCTAATACHRGDSATGAPPHRVSHAGQRCLELVPARRALHRFCAVLMTQDRYQRPLIVQYEASNPLPGWRRHNSSSRGCSPQFTIAAFLGCPCCGSIRNETLGRRRMQ